MTKKRDRNQIILSNIHAEVTLLASLKISSIESNMINNLIQSSNADSEDKFQPC